MLHFSSWVIPITMALEFFYDIVFQRPTHPLCNAQPLGHLSFCPPLLCYSY
jgi:hypothetical protein